MPGASDGTRMKSYMLLKVAMDLTLWFSPKLYQVFPPTFQFPKILWHSHFCSCCGHRFFSSYTLFQQNVSPEKGAEIPGTNIFQDFNRFMEIQFSSDELRPDGRGKNRAVFLEIALL